MAENSVVQPQRQDRTDSTTAESGDVIAFDGRRGPLLQLVLKNMVLTVLTLGIYRFWAKTAVRQGFWRHISIAGERLEYTGTGGELFVGFLIATCVLLPFFAVTSIVEPIASISATGAVVWNGVYFFGLFLLTQTAIFRMRRYRLTRTMWRGIRCGLDGETWDYVKAATRYWLLVIVTLGFAYPWMRAELSRHLMTRTRFGTEYFGFEATAQELLAHWRPVAWLWIGILVCAGTALALGDPEPQRPGAQIARYSFWAMIVLLIVQVPFYVRYRAREFRVFAAGTSLGEVRFESDLQTKQIIWLIGATAILTVIFLLLLAALFGGLLTQSAGGLGVALLGLTIGVLVFATVVLPAINLVIVQFGLTKAVVNSLTVINLPAVEAVIQSTQEVPGHGEGLADAFDLGEF